MEIVNILLKFFEESFYFIKNVFQNKGNLYVILAIFIIYIIYKTTLSFFKTIISILIILFIMHFLINNNYIENNNLFELIEIVKNLIQKLFHVFV